MNIQKWKKAVIHLEGVRDSYDSSLGFEKVAQAHRDKIKGTISGEEFEFIWTNYGDQLVAGSRDLRYQGTAIFLEHEKKLYLLTAKHVVFDEIITERQHSEYELVFASILRVPSLDETLNFPVTILSSLNVLSAGLPTLLPFTFSCNELDLAIISLNQTRTKVEFGQELIERGYVPITVTDIAQHPDCEGQEVFTVGFPESTSLVGQLELSEHAAHWASRFYSTPVFSFGRVSMCNEHLHYFWADMSVYPGNSGGPVIANDRLVGIVSAQAVTDIENSDGGLTAGIPFGKIINAEHALGLLAIQIEKDVSNGYPVY